MTGGAGFIGSNFVRLALDRSDAHVVVLDKLTYAGNLQSLADVSTNPRFDFVEADIADADAVRDVFRKYGPSALLNFAAETHVDRSIDGPADFVQTNVVGTFTLLEAARAHLEGQDERTARDFRFLHVSTDEVYGSLGESGLFSETTPYDPNSPYSASKAGADHLVRAYHATYGLPALLTNCSNNYGPYQYPEKLIPLMIRNAVAGKPLPVYGAGANVRDWLFVEDHCRALDLVVCKGVPGRTYNVGGSNERTNLEVVHALCDLVDEVRPLGDGGNRRSLVSFVADRPGHDLRYAIDAERITTELGWVPDHDFVTGLRATVTWYLENEAWCEEVTTDSYDGSRLGLQT